MILNFESDLRKQPDFNDEKSMLFLGTSKYSTT
jgi:hypothetical protein